MNDWKNRSEMADARWRYPVEWSMDTDPDPSIAPEVPRPVDWYADVSVPVVIVGDEVAGEP